MEGERQGITTMPYPPRAHDSEAGSSGVRAIKALHLEELELELMFDDELEYPLEANFDEELILEVKVMVEL